MVVKKKKIVIAGQEVEVDVFETRLIPGSGKESEAIEALYREEEIEKAIQSNIKEIATIAKIYNIQKKDIWFYYRIGEVLQFVDKKGFTKERMRIWERIADNLIPEAFFPKGIVPKKSKTYPEIMYLLAKQRKKDIPRVTWSHWFEIFQYPKIYKNPKAVENLLSECEKNGLSSEQLRKRVQGLNKTL